MPIIGRLVGSNSPYSDNFSPAAHSEFADADVVGL